MAHLFTIRPWEWEHLHYGQTLGLCHAIDRHRAELKKAAQS